MSLWNRQQSKWICAGCQVTSEKQVLCQSKTQPCMKNAQLRRTLRNLVKIANACQALPGQFFQQDSRFLSWVNRQLTSSCKHQSQSQLWFFVPLAFWDGDFLKLLVFSKHTELFIENLKWRREIFCSHAVFRRRHTDEFCHIR